MSLEAIQVPTRVIISEGEQQVRELQSDTTLERRKIIDSFGLNTTALMEELDDAVQKLIAAEATQESAKAHLKTEYSQDRELAEKGYRYKLATDARVRAYLSLHPNRNEIRDHFRFGKLHSPRPGPVATELSITMAELKRHKQDLENVGIDDAYLENGLQILEALHLEKNETHQVLKEQVTVSEGLRDLELFISTSLRQLVAFDEAAAAGAPGEGRVFNLSLVQGEVARVRGIAEQGKSIAASDVV